MNPLGPVWRCRVCEGVNRGGRVCATCGAEVPLGEPLRAAVRTVKPSSTRPATPPPVPPNPTRRELRDYPVPEEIYPVESDDRLALPESESRRVYKRERCHDCGTPILLGTIEGRATYTCPRCQPELAG